MYIKSLRIQNIKSFEDSKEIEFQYPGKEQKLKVRYPNINLLLGNNGSGKTTVLKAIAMAALGPAIGDSNLPTFKLIRKTRDHSETKTGEISASFSLNKQDHNTKHANKSPLECRIEINKIGEIERLTSNIQNFDIEFDRWKPIFSSDNDAFFFVGYGATRRVESRERIDPGARQASSFARAQRIRSLFEDSYSLYPLTIWLPALQIENPGRYRQVFGLLNKLLSDTTYTFTGEMEQGEYVFATKSVQVPFPALSDGYRTFIGWLGDLLYHIVNTCPKGKKLVENQGMVMLDEVDLHLHPKWQMTILPRLSRTLPKLQFMVTSHSPLVVGSLERFNILFLRNSGSGTKAVRIDVGIHGLDADQILISDFFGLNSTRADEKDRQLKELTKKAVLGDKDSALAMLEEMSKGLENNAL